MSSTGSTPAAATQLEISGSRQLPNWMIEQNVSLAFTTYQAGKLFLIGVGPEGRLATFQRTLDRCMGLCVHGNSMYTTTLYQLWRFENALSPGELANGHDRLYVPQIAYVTGDLDIHDLAVDSSGRLVFINTLFGCLATTSETHSFRPLWKPQFLSKLAAEDRCHLNGLAMKDGSPRWVTATSQSDVADGWRDRRRDGGCVIDIDSNQIVASGLSMPHSPRWHQGKLWLHNSGTGELGYIDLDKGRFEAVCFCAGYLRGLDFMGDFAIVGLSKPRHNKTFQGLALDESLKKKDADPRCGVQVIDLRTGDIVHWLHLDGIVEELYDVVALKGCRRPMAIGFRSDEIRRTITIEDPCFARLQSAA